MAERPEDLNLPNTVVTRIIKDAIPDGVNVSKEARLAISKAASVFVLYATSCANNFALKNKRKTINAQDVLAAMEDMEFEQFVEPLQQCQEAFLQEKMEKKKEKNQKPTTIQQAPIVEENEVEEVSDNEEDEAMDEDSVEKAEDNKQANISKDQEELIGSDKNDASEEEDLGD